MKQKIIILEVVFLYVLFFATNSKKGNYFKETDTEVRLQCNNHKKKTSKTKTSISLTAHFKQVEHSIDNIRCELLASSFKCQQE